MFDFNAGKYALFVWSAYGLTALVFVLMIVDSLARSRRWRQTVERREREARDSEPAAKRAG
jgi:heme exporter protein D